MEQNTLTCSWNKTICGFSTLHCVKHDDSDGVMKIIMKKKVFKSDHDDDHDDHDDHDEEKDNMSLCTKQGGSVLILSCSPDRSVSS